jgi:hypothetical protein
MIEKIIEKTYKYHMPTPNELFEKFKGKFSKASLPDSWYALTPWTTTILDIFYEIGRDLGYTPNREYLRLDQTWEIRHKDISVIILALEHENTSSVSEILDDELQKLLDVKAFVKVLIFYPRFPLAMFETGEFVFPEIQEKIRSAKIKTDEKYVILGLTYLTDQNVIHVSAFSFDSEGKGEDLGDFEINYTSKTQQI